jgi:hypothetical protein
MFSRFVDDFGYDNLLLIDNKGDVVYTLTKSPIFATNLLYGPYGNTNVANMFRGLMGSKEQDAAKLVDFMRLDSALGKPVALIGHRSLMDPTRLASSPSSCPSMKSTACPPATSAGSRNGWARRAKPSWSGRIF